jgi:protein-tyrosine phosphatase
VTPPLRQLGPAPTSVVGTDSDGQTRLFTVLTVCTGNICRSPAVERLLAARLGDDSQVLATSAGTRAVVGSPVSGPMVPLMRAAGASADAFVARQLTPAIVREADLVLALTRQHRSTVVDLHPAAVRRTFTLRELARLAATVDPDDLPPGSPAERLAALVPLAAAERGRNHHARAGDDDVIDPYRRGDAVYADVFRTIQPAVELLARLARG